MISMPLQEAANLLAATIHGQDNVTFSGISTDTRTIQKGNLFVALRGENYDAHEFISEAVKKGAAAVLVQHVVAGCTIPQLQVVDPLLALGHLAKAWRKRFNLPIITVTGSNGKTTTKNMIAAILLQANQNKSDAVLFTQGNLNNAIGLPLTLAQLAPSHKHAVIEMGMNHFGELDYLTHLLMPTTALITNVGPAHLAGVEGTLAGVAKAKGEIYAGLPANGIGIVNADDPFVHVWRNAIGDRQCVSFGMKNAADVRGELLISAHDNGALLTTPFRLTYNNQSIDILLNLPGEHNVMNALAASAAALVNGISLADVKIALEKIQTAPGRLQMKSGQQGIRIIDDTYNANPASLKAAIKTLVKYSGTKVLVLGDMRELGPAGENLHRESGQTAKDLGVDYLFATGDLSKAAVHAFGKNAYHFPDHDTLIKALNEYVKSDVIMLVKGSRSMKMEQVVKAFVV